jgi:hypothetical protein
MGESHLITIFEPIFLIAGDSIPPSGKHGIHFQRMVND